MSTDKDLQSKFDYVLYNNYDAKSKQKLMEIVKKIMEDEKR